MGTCSLQVSRPFFEAVSEQAGAAAGTGFELAVQAIRSSALGCAAPRKGHRRRGWTIGWWPPPSISARPTRENYEDVGPPSRRRQRCFCGSGGADEQGAPWRMRRAWHRVFQSPRDGAASTGLAGQPADRADARCRGPAALRLHPANGRRVTHGGLASRACWIARPAQQTNRRVSNWSTACHHRPSATRRPRGFEAAALRQVPPGCTSHSAVHRVQFLGGHRALGRARAPALRVEPAMGCRRRCKCSRYLQVSLRFAPSLLPIAGSTRARPKARQPPSASLQRESSASLYLLQRQDRFSEPFSHDEPINFPAPSGGVFAASHHSPLRSPNLKNAASGGEYTRSDSGVALVFRIIEMARSRLVVVWLPVVPRRYRR